MNFFGKKDVKDNVAIAKMLANATDKIIKRGTYDRESVEFIKLSFEYNALIRKNEIDEDRFLVDKMDSIIKFSQESAKVHSNMRGKDTVSIFETLPDLMMSVKTKLKDKERIHEEIKESTKQMMKSLDSISEELYKSERR
jgi:hypothetical protein